MKLRVSPLALTVGGFVVMGALAVRAMVAIAQRGAEGAIFAGAAFALYAGWMAWESRVSAREAKRHDFTEDRSTMELAAAAKIALLAAALLPVPEVGGPRAAVGLATMVVGIGLRASAVRSLGKDYAHRIRPPAVPLVENGPYAFVRHPAYLGTLLAHAGVVLVFFSAWSMVALALGWLPAVLVRTLVEDRYLRRFADYQGYAARVKFRLFPGIF